MKAASHTPLRITGARVVWLLTAIALMAITVATMWGSLSDVRWVNPDLLFVMVTGSAMLCILAATVVTALADKRDLAELGLLGSALMAASVLPLVRGLVVPGVLYNETPAFAVATFLTLPVAVAVATPLLLPHSSFGRWAARNWRSWSVLSILGVFVVASLVVFFPEAISAPNPTGVVTVVVSVAMLIAIAGISLRQLRYFELGQRSANMVASLSLLMVAVTALLPLSRSAYSPGFWWLHLAGVLGVVVASIALAVAKRMAGSTRQALSPVLLRDPLAAFELGLSPIVHRFVADLDRKDAETRDHVVRTAEMAVRVGERFQLPARQLRDLGLAALLHDVGKLNIPDELLNKPSRLTAEEYEVVKLHAVDGEQMLLAEPTLASVAPIVRAHHERLDGRGYPDGLVGKEIPLASRIIAVCDALDAMTHDREYRSALSTKMAFAVLHEHAGSQWDAAVIEQVIAVLPSMIDSNLLDRVGLENGEHASESTNDSTNMVPDDIGAMLIAVDAEI